MADDDAIVKPTSTLEWEARLDAEDPDRTEDEVDPDGRQLHLDDNDLTGFVGAAPEYRNYANETDRPFFAEEGAEREFEARHTNQSDGILAREREALGGEVHWNTSGTIPAALETDRVKAVKAAQERDSKDSTSSGDESGDGTSSGEREPSTPVAPPAAPVAPRKAATVRPK